jgi:hypothetical protein
METEFCFGKEYYYNLISKCNNNENAYKELFLTNCTDKKIKMRTNPFSILLRFKTSPIKLLSNKNNETHKMGDSEEEEEDEEEEEADIEEDNTNGPTKPYRFKFYYDRMQNIKLFLKLYESIMEFWKKIKLDYDNPLEDILEDRDCLTHNEYLSRYDIIFLSIFCYDSIITKNQFLTKKDFQSRLPLSIACMTFSCKYLYDDMFTSNSFKYEPSNYLANVNKCIYDNLQYLDLIYEPISHNELIEAEMFILSNTENIKFVNIKDLTDMFCKEISYGMKLKLKTKQDIDSQEEFIRAYKHIFHMINCIIVYNFPFITTESEIELFDFRLHLMNAFIACIVTYKLFYRIHDKCYEKILMISNYILRINSAKIFETNLYNKKSDLFYNELKYILDIFNYDYAAKRHHARYTLYNKEVFANYYKEIINIIFEINRIAVQNNEFSCFIDVIFKINNTNGFDNQLILRNNNNNRNQVCYLVKNKSLKILKERKNETLAIYDRKTKLIVLKNIRENNLYQTVNKSMNKRQDIIKKYRETIDLTI